MKESGRGLPLPPVNAPATVSLLINPNVRDSTIPPALCLSDSLKLPDSLYSSIPALIPSNILKAATIGNPIGPAALAATFAPPVNTFVNDLFVALCVTFLASLGSSFVN